MEAIARPSIIAAAVRLARQLQVRATALQTPQERRQQAELDRMVQNPTDKVTLLQLTDQAFRSSAAQRSADQLTHILDVQGVPRFFSPLDRTLLRGFQSFGSYLPGVAVPLVQDKMHHETANVVLPAEPELLGPHLRARREEGVRMNVNFLGEALHGEAEAERRLERYLAALADPDVEVVSVKISTLYSQISPLARSHTIEVLCGRMERLYRASAQSRFVRADGREVAKLVYMDMEEYRDMSITVEAFTRTLDRPALSQVRAGLVLQAYLPDAFAVQRDLTAWARGRLAEGGAPIRLRIVKGANMEMERVEASLMGWEPAPFQRKRDTDANYKRMLAYALEPEHAEAVHLGIATHNLFDQAYGLVLARERQVEALVQFEMLEGMANSQRRALFEETRDLLLYAPACRRDDFIYAIGYLIRRLDENTGPDNFLRHAFKLSVDSEEWRALESDFRASFDALGGLPDTPRRTQDRRRPPVARMKANGSWEDLQNEPDTDFSLPHNARWAKEIYSAWAERCGELAPEAPTVVAGEERGGPRVLAESFDPSRPGVVAGRYRVAELPDVEDAVACARRDPSGWRCRTARERGRVLRAAAQALREARAELMGIALAEAGKILTESDSEVSEAVDFCEFYARSAEFLAELPDIEASGRGVVVVVTPWNFPIAIPCGGVAAALAAGNCVILKPAPATVLCAYLLCQCFWRAGVPRSALQFLFAPDALEATRLVTHPTVNAVVFTGGTATALHLLARKPSLRLLAETGGKNATIVTAMSDRDLAIKHVLQSAFSHAGQKCSATSLLILEQEVYEDDGFRVSLADAVRSLPVGSAWEATTKVGPLIRAPGGPLARALGELSPGETWLVRPQQHGQNPQLWSPGVKWGVAAGSLCHTTELFGPLLAVMCAHDLDGAISLVHQTGYGLTSGLHSLDDREQARWSESLRAGNLYINRSTTGAVVLRQPFGGMGKSAMGPGLKAGGPNYVVPLMHLRPRAAPADSAPSAMTTRGTDLPTRDAALEEPVARFFALLSEQADVAESEVARLRAAAASYRHWMEREFSREHDNLHLSGQDNLRRYLPLAHLRIRVDPRDSDFEVLARILAARAAGCLATVSYPSDAGPRASALSMDQLDGLTESWAARVEFVVESDATLAAILREEQTDRVRYASTDRVPAGVQRAAAELGSYIAADPVLPEGRIELLHYFREQSLCVDYHRYGNLGARSDSESSADRADRADGKME